MIPYLVSQANKIKGREYMNRNHNTIDNPTPNTTFSKNFSKNRFKDLPDRKV